MEAMFGACVWILFSRRVYMDKDESKGILCDVTIYQGVNMVPYWLVILKHDHCNGTHIVPNQCGKWTPMNVFVVRKNMMSYGSLTAAVISFHCRFDSIQHFVSKISGTQDSPYQEKQSFLYWNELKLEKLYSQNQSYMRDKYTYIYVCKNIFIPAEINSFPYVDNLPREKWYNCGWSICYITQDLV